MATTTVSASDGVGAIQTALDGSSSGDTVEVTGNGNYTWSSSLEVPNGVTLSVSNDVSVTVPASNNLTGYLTGSRTVYSLITCKDRTSASNVTIEGGEYDMSNFDVDAGLTGAWLHNASDSVINDVIMHGVGINHSRDYRAFGLALTRCTNSIIRDSEAHDSGYDNIAVRGGCQGCRVINSGGTNGSSGTIQTARWGYWGLNDPPQGTTFHKCWGRRIYCHDGIDTTWNGCQSTGKLQTLGTDNAQFRNSSDFEGTVLIYTYDSGTDYALIEAMEFVDAGQKDVAIKVAPNSGEPIGTVEVDSVWAERPIFVGFQNDHIDASADIGTVEVTNSTAIGAGANSSIVTQASDAPEADTLVFRECEFYNFDDGFTGSYDRVVVENCEFHGIADPFASLSANTLERNGNTFGDEAAPEQGSGPWDDVGTPGGGGGGAGPGQTTTRSILTYNLFTNVQNAVSGSSSAAFTFKKSRVGGTVSGEGVTVDSPGGDTVQVRQCTFEASGGDETPNVHVHGEPTSEGEVTKTWHFMPRPELAIRQSIDGEIVADAESGGFQSMTVTNNAFGEETPSDSSIGSQQFE